MFALQNVSHHTSSLHSFLSIRTLIHVISNPRITTLVLNLLALQAPNQDWV